MAGYLLKSDLELLAEVAFVSVGHVEVEIFQGGEKDDQTFQQIDLGVYDFVLAVGPFDHFTSHGLDNLAGDDDRFKDGEMDVSEDGAEEIGYFWEDDEVLLGSQVAVEQVEQVLVGFLGVEDDKRLFGLFGNILFVEEIAEQEEGVGKNIRNEGNVDTWNEDRHKFKSQFSPFIFYIWINFVLIHFLRVNLDNFKSVIDHLTQRFSNFWYIVFKKTVELLDQGDDTSDERGLKFRFIVLNF